jgi:hypothetical protein
LRVGNHDIEIIATRKNAPGLGRIVSLDDFIALIQKFVRHAEPHHRIVFNEKDQRNSLEAKVSGFLQGARPASSSPAI